LGLLVLFAQRRVINVDIDNVDNVVPTAYARYFQRRSRSTRIKNVRRLEVVVGQRRVVRDSRASSGRKSASSSQIHHCSRCADSRNGGLQIIIKKFAEFRRKLLNDLNCGWWIYLPCLLDRSATLLTVYVRTSNEVAGEFVDLYTTTMAN